MKRCFSCFNTYDDKLEICPYCGKSEILKPSSPIHLVPGMSVGENGRFIIGESIGEGGFGVVYKAWDSKLETIVALKEFFVSGLMTRSPGIKQMIITKSRLEEYQYRKDRFLAEARTLAKFGANRSIPNVFEYFEENNTAYFVMEYMDGISLAEYLEQEGAIDKEFAVFIATEVANAVKALHDQNIVHKDIAPDNIFICRGKEASIKLYDLGAAKLNDATDGHVDVILKVGYSPAEQYVKDQRDVGTWSDIYALGATMYAMLTGTKPEEATNRKIEDTLKSPIELGVDISENLDNTIMKAIAVDPHLRFKRIEEFIEALKGERKVIPLEKEKQRRRRRRIAGIATGLLIVALVAGLSVGLFQKKQAENMLKEAELTVYFVGEEGTARYNAMEYIVQDFCEKNPQITINLEGVSLESYDEAIKSYKIANGVFPDIFELYTIDSFVKKSKDELVDISDVLESKQAKECLFLNQYSSYYPENDDLHNKTVPLAISVPVAYVITNGHVSSPFEGDYYVELSDFGQDAVIAHDEVFYVSDADLGRESFFKETDNESSVIISKTMAMNMFKTLINYEKKCVYYNSSNIESDFAFEWCVGQSNDESNADNKKDAAKRLLSWMLGESYQNVLMITSRSESGAYYIPINKKCFEEIIKSESELSPINKIYDKLSFKVSQE